MAPPPACPPLAAGEGLDSSQWAAQEFGNAPLGDQRLSQRLVASAAHLATQPGRAFTAVSQSDVAAIKGYYRLIDRQGPGGEKPNGNQPFRDSVVDPVAIGVILILPGSSTEKRAPSNLFSNSYGQRAGPARISHQRSSRGRCSTAVAVRTNGKTLKA